MMEPWQWDETVWRGKVNKVRAGRSLKPKSWKNGARCAVALSFDSDHETNELRDGGESIGRMSQGQYGNRVGIPRILKTLSDNDIKATFFVPAVVGLLYPDEQRRVIAARPTHWRRSPAFAPSACARPPGIFPA
jgi:peptidoglycan-N-acetylglucosamine deacetylase